MAKKVAISVTIDGDVLRDVDNLLRNVQERELRSRRQLSTRSSLIEQMLTERLREASSGS
jgi:metal-responsive CopG/Arc/MetJ family transcriptional regulator